MAFPAEERVRHGFAQQALRTGDDVPGLKHEAADPRTIGQNSVRVSAINGHRAPLIMQAGAQPVSRPPTPTGRAVASDETTLPYASRTYVWRQDAADHNRGTAGSAASTVSLRHGDDAGRTIPAATAASTG
jgi:hypothetical protein